MITITEHFDLDSFRQLIATLTGLPINRVLQSGLQQDTSSLDFFVIVRNDPSRQLSTHLNFDGANEVQTIESQKETDVIVSFHGDNAVSMAEFFQLALITEQANQLFDSIKTGLVRSTDVRNLTIPFAGGYEERAEITLTLSHNFNIEYKQNRIESVDIGLVLNQ